MFLFYGMQQCIKAYIISPITSHNDIRFDCTSFCYPIKQRRVSLLKKCQLLQTIIHMGWTFKAFPFLRIPFQQQLREDATQEQRRLYVVIYQANQAKYSCWKKRSVGQIVTSSFTANFDTIICIVEVSGLSTCTGTSLKDAV